MEELEPQENLEEVFELPTPEELERYNFEPKQAGAILTMYSYLAEKGNDLKELANRHSRTARVAISMTPILVGLAVYSGPDFLNFLRQDDVKNFVKYEMIYNPNYQFLSPLDNETSMETIEHEYSEHINEIAEDYGVPQEAIYKHIMREYLKAEKRPFGMNATSLQEIKSRIVSSALSLSEDIGYQESEGGLESGFSTGYLNQKPELFTLKVITSIKDPELREAMLENYDVERGHVNAKTLSDVVTGDLESSIELSASVMQHWIEPINFADDAARKARDKVDASELYRGWTEEQKVEILENTCCSNPFARTYAYQILNLHLDPFEPNNLEKALLDGTKDYGPRLTDGDFLRSDPKFEGMSADEIMKVQKIMLKSTSKGRGKSQISNPN